MFQKLQALSMHYAGNAWALQMNRWSLEKLVEFIRVARRIKTVTTPLKANCNTMLQILYTPQHDPVEASLSWISQPKVRLDILILSFFSVCTAMRGLFTTTHKV
jgi:hypothetical protein